MFAKLNIRQYLIVALVLLAIMRLIALGLYPLMDSTEARYAEIGRKMLELNDWITPWFDYGIPFWGKPPLSFWMTALSFKLFGVNEFAARLPHYLCGLLVLWLVWHCARQRSATIALYSLVVLGGSLLFFMSAGLVMTDMWLLLGTTLTMLGFWQALQGRGVQLRAPWQWLFFVGLAIGLLAKGPIAIVLSGIPVGLWMVATGNYRTVWTALPWLRGSLLILLLTSPWYVLAEQKTPGFLDYFLIGEHFHRFVTAGWQGDLYGSAHDFPRGTIWAFMLVDLLPWSVIFPLIYFKSRGLQPVDGGSSLTAQLKLYLLLWGLAPAVFFTAAGNILWPYVLPAFPAIALLLAAWLADQQGMAVSAKDRLLLIGLAVTGGLMLISLLSLPLTGQQDKKSAKKLVAVYQQHKSQDEPLIYYGNRPFSASFYSHGEALQVNDTAGLEQLVQDQGAIVAVRTRAIRALRDSGDFQLQPLATIDKYQLFKISDKQAPAFSLSAASNEGAGN
jgi:4-amino-4-deoxy-L-arabinose transferase-like glycosyltransferase